MRVEMKFCGMTRAADAEEAARLGARYVGAIFAGGPRCITPVRAAECFASLTREVRRVGVFGDQPADAIADAAREAVLDVIQLHDDPDAATVDIVRRRTGLEVWGVARIGDEGLPGGFSELSAAADAVVLDARVAGRLGGTGRAFGWDEVAERLALVRGGTPLVMAGGLTPENVARAIGVLRPDVVDVSSGVEISPGVKDHTRMRRFGEAVRSAGETR